MKCEGTAGWRSRSHIHTFTTTYVHVRVLCLTERQLWLQNDLWRVDWTTYFAHSNSARRENWSFYCLTCRLTSGYVHRWRHKMSFCVHCHYQAMSMSLQWQHLLLPWWRVLQQRTSATYTVQKYADVCRMWSLVCREVADLSVFVAVRIDKLMADCITWLVGLQS